MNRFKVQELKDSDNMKFRVSNKPVFDKSNNRVNKTDMKEENKEFGKTNGSDTLKIASLLEFNAESLYKGVLLSEILGLPKCKRTVSSTRNMLKYNK